MTAFSIGTTGRRLLAAACAILPWPAKRLVFTRILGWDISPHSYVGLSIVLVDYLSMGRNSRIGHLNVFKGCHSVKMEEEAVIGNLNWITALPENRLNTFSDAVDRSRALEMGEHSALTSRHIVECTERVSIGAFSIVAGYRSQILTHSIRLDENRQRWAPVSIGAYTFVGTSVVILPGARLADFSVLGANSLLRSGETEPFALYSGVPAAKVKSFDEALGYFTRRQGLVT